MAPPFCKHNGDAQAKQQHVSTQKAHEAMHNEELGTNPPTYPFLCQFTYNCLICFKGGIRDCDGSSFYHDGSTNLQT
jgi:hypothetical protein